MTRARKRRVDIDCNGEGVLFVEAMADGCISEYGELFTPSMEMRRLIPHIHYDAHHSYPLLIIQVHTHTHTACLFVCLSVCLSVCERDNSERWVGGHQYVCSAETVDLRRKSKRVGERERERKIEESVNYWRYLMMKLQYLCVCVYV